MKKFYLLTKTLLVVVCLLVGASSAWGETTWKTHKIWDFVTDYAATDTVGIKPTKYWAPSGTGTGASMSLATTISSATAITENTNSRYYGLLFHADRTKMTLSSGGVTLGGGAAYITIPNLEPGQRVTVTIDSENGVERYTSSTATMESFTTSSIGNSRWETKGVVATGGNLVLRRSGGTTFRVKSILVESPAYAELFNLDFEDAETYTNGWTITNTTSTSQLDIAGNKKILFDCHTGNQQANETYDFSTLVSGLSVDYTFSFDYAFAPTGSSQSASDYSTTVLIIYGGETELFHVTCASSGGTSTMSVVNNGTTIGSITSGTRFVQPTAGNFYTFTIVGDETKGTVLYIRDNSGNTINLSNNVLNASRLLATKIVSTPHKPKYSNYASMASFDNIVFRADLGGLKSRASAAIDNYNAIKSEIMNSTVYSTLNGAYTTLAAYSTDDAIVADGEGYMNAIIALEGAIPTAQISIDNFKILNDLITRANTFAETVTSYEAPEGASTVYTSNADVDPVALAEAVRAEVIEEGVKNDDTDITAIIINSEFELNSTLGWTIAGDAATAPTDLDKYGATESNGSGGYQYYTGWNGRNISQIIPSLPAGKYRLTAGVKSWSGGAPVRLFGNGILSEVENGDDHTMTLDFTTTGNESNVKIGIGGTGNNNDTDNTWGTWGYQIDYFTLTYVGQDELALAKASLAEEIETATALKDSWTPKVGTAPFKYDATYYNALNTAIDAAQTVIDEDGDVVSAYTSAESTLETAESNMASSTQNIPDPDKYYQIFVANNDGTASDYNLYMLYERTKTQVKVSATPYPIKIVVDPNNSSYYNIQTPYGNDLCTDKNAKTTAYVNSAEGIETRCNQIKFTLNDNGTIVLGGNAGSGNFNNYQASVSEGSLVTAPQGGSGKWVISDAVEITDVTLAVNATTAWGTFIAPYDNLTPSTVKAYTVSHKEGGSISLEENETGVLNANTPYILSTKESSNVSVTFKGIANNTQNTYTENGLVGLLAAETVPADSYILQYQSEADGTAFYKLDISMTGTKYRCYLNLDDVPTSNNNSRASVWMDIYGDVTGVGNVEVPEATAKNGVYVEKGKIVIYKKGMKFNAVGVKL